MVGGRSTAASRRVSKGREWQRGVMEEDVKVVAHSSDAPHVQSQPAIISAWLVWPFITGKSATISPTSTTPLHNEEVEIGVASRGAGRGEKG